MGFKLQLKGAWREFREFFNRKRRRDRLRREMRDKIREQLGLLRRDIIEYINTESHGVPNSPLTILIKGSSRPLVDHSDLRSSVNVRTKISTEGVFGGVGVLRMKRGKNGKTLWNIAVALHEGYTVKVTPKVRAAVFAEMRKRRGKKVRLESSQGARTWKVRGRPFIKDPFEAAEERIRMALGEGVRLTLRK